MTLPAEFTIEDDFPAVSYEQWRALVEKDLNGAPFEKRLVTHTYEGIDIQPVYAQRDGASVVDPNGLPGCPRLCGARNHSPKPSRVLIFAKNTAIPIQRKPTAKFWRILPAG